MILIPGIFASSFRSISNPLLFDAIMALSPAGYWRMDDASGSVLTDVSGNSRNGSIVGTPDYNQTSLDPTDSDNASMRFPSAASYATVPHGSHFNGAYTWIGLVKTETTGDGGIFHKGDASIGGQQGSYSYRATGLSPSNRYSFSWFNGSWRLVLSTRRQPDNSTMLLVIVYNGAQSVTFYIGDPAPCTQPMANAVINNTQTLKLGVLKSTSYANPIVGTEDEVAWVSRAITQAEVQTLFDTIASTKQATTFNPNDASTALIFSNGNNTVSNTASAYQAARGLNSHYTGKKFFSLVADAVGSFDWFGGVSTVVAETNGVAPARVGAWTFRNNGFVFNQNIGTTDTGASFTNGDKISVAIDFDAGKGWFAKNDVWVLSGDPAAGTNPSFTFTANTYLFPFWSSDNAAGTSTATLHCTTANGLTIPSGFSLWG